MNVHFVFLQSDRFVGGLISNFPVIRKAVELMQKLRVLLAIFSGLVCLAGAAWSSTA